MLIVTFRAYFFFSLSSRIIHVSHRYTAGAQGWGAWLHFVKSSFCAWTARGFCLSRRGLPYSISLVKSGDHGSWMLRHECYNQLQHIMEVLILQRSEIRWGIEKLRRLKMRSVFCCCCCGKSSIEPKYTSWNSINFKIFLDPSTPSSSGWPMLTKKTQSSCSVV